MLQKQFTDIVQLIMHSRSNAAKAVNTELVIYLKKIESWTGTQRKLCLNPLLSRVVL